MNFRERVEDLNNQIINIRSEFEEHIKDQSVPLEDRWKLFMSAPNNLRHTASCITHFDGLPSDAIGYDGPVYAERHQEVDMDQIITVWEEREEYDYDFSKWDIEAFKEDVLKKNIYSFTYDW